MPKVSHAPVSSNCRVAVIWIDWYPYHVARMQGLCAAPTLAGGVAGIELVGGVGVHAGLKFRQALPPELSIASLMPESNWASANKWKLSRLLWRKLSELQPELVMVPGYYTLPAIAAAVWARLHRRTSMLMTESASYDHVRHGWREWLKSALMRVLFTRAIAGGKDHTSYLRQLGFPADRISLFYDVVDNDFFAAGTAEQRAATTRSQQGLPDNYFLFVGRLAPEKNVRGLLAAWLAYRAHGGTWKLVLAGDGPERAALESVLSGSVYREDVTITGLRNAEQLLPLYAFANAFVLPSTREPWGLVVNEAMASGLPVIVTDRCGCANDLVRGVGSGEIVPAGDEAALAGAMRAMEQMAPGERAAMGQKAQERIRVFSPRRFGLEVASVVDRTDVHAPGLAQGGTA